MPAPGGRQGRSERVRIVCVHQGYELYGSDRAFIESVAAIRASWPSADIAVILPREGPIVPLLREIATSVSFEPLWILRRKDLPRLAAFGAVTLPLAVARAARLIRGSDLTYVNTTVVIDHLVAARLFPGKVISHVHEIPEGKALPVFKALLRWSGADIIFNSRATEKVFDMPAGVRSRIIYNGVAGPAEADPTTYDGTRPLRVLMLGRISRIKGQEVLVEAIASLEPALRERIELRIVGNAFEDPGREAMLATLIKEKGLADRVTLSPFVPDPSPLLHWADIVAVPSRRPESLGRVAVEAMAYGKPPLASSIGGLREVVKDGVTGWLVEPDQSAPLAAALRRIVLEPASWASFPKAGRARYESLFSEAAAAAGIRKLIEEMMARRAGR